VEVLDSALDLYHLVEYEQVDEGCVGVVVC
jgi:hypothetical protein